MLQNLTVMKVKLGKWSSQPGHTSRAKFINSSAEIIWNRKSNSNSIGFIIRA